MLPYVLRRLLIALALGVGASVLSFLVVHLARGDAAEVLMRDRFGGVRPPPEVVEETRRAFHLDRPVLERLGRWGADAARGDFGTSFFTGDPVASEAWPRALRTLLLALLALAVATAVSLMLGLLPEILDRRSADAAGLAATSVLSSAPPYVLGVFLAVVAAVRSGWFPSAGDTDFAHYVLPAATLGLAAAAAPARALRDALATEMGSDYVRTALAHGVPRPRAVARHALKNAAVPYAAVLGLSFRNLAAGALVVETLFEVRGLGSYLVLAVEHRDLPAIQFAVFLVAVVSATVTLAVDLALGALDPRIRLAGARP